MTTPAGPSLAEERTRLARVRTVVALVLTAALVARAALSAHPLVALACFPAAALGLILAVRLGRAPIGSAGLAALSASTVLLALAGLALA